MERFYTKIIGTPVTEEDSIRPLNTVKDLVIDPEKGTLLAFVVDVGRNLIVTPMDLLSWHDVMHIRSRNDIISGDDVLRVQNVQKMGVKIFHNKVETKEGKSLGKVLDFSIDSNLMTLKKLFVAKDILGLVRYDGRVITAKNILEILPEKIVVKDDMPGVKEEVKEKRRLEDLAAA